MNGSPRRGRAQSGRVGVPEGEVGGVGRVVGQLQVAEVELDGLVLARRLRARVLQSGLAWTRWQRAHARPSAGGRALFYHLSLKYTLFHNIMSKLMTVEEAKGV
jgi:hypothetical protein